MRKQRLTKNCTICGIEFERPPTCNKTEWGHRKYCSNPCRYVGQKKPPNKTCPQCGIAFRSKTWDNKRAKFCSRECRDNARRKPLPTCERCGKTCKKHRRRFCSPACRYAQLTGAKNPMYIDNTRPCLICGKVYKPELESQKYCSQVCYGKSERGKNHRNYRGDHMRKGRQELHSAFWQARAAEIRQRDKVCQRCGKTPEDNGRVLDVHHIIPYRLGPDNSPKNLIALCRVCHSTADDKFRRNETK